MWPNKKFMVKNIFLTQCNKEVSQEKWVLDTAASMHVCRDQEMFETLEQKGDFGYVQIR